MRKLIPTMIATIALMLGVLGANASVASAAAAFPPGPGAPAAFPPGPGIIGVL